MRPVGIRKNECMTSTLLRVQTKGDIMNSKNRCIVIAILSTLFITIALTLFAWIRVEQLERELAVQRTDVYVLKLVQVALLNQHGLHVELEQHSKKEQPVPVIEPYGSETN